LAVTPKGGIFRGARGARPNPVRALAFTRQPHRIAFDAQQGTHMFQELIATMAREVEKLQHELNVILPHEIRKAVELGDLKENSEYKAAKERQQFVQARLGQLTERVTKLANIDITQIPGDKVGLGSRVEVTDQATNAVESYELVFGDAGELEDRHVTMGSPIGRALQGKAVGETAILKLPTSVRRLTITRLVTIHDRAADELV
jgi:transcription elongation factor GreA